MANSNAKVQLKAMDDGYSLVVDGEESEVAGYGDPIEMETSNGRRFIALCDAQGQEVESVLEFWAYECSPVVDVPVIDEDEDEDEGEDEDEQEGGTDDEEEVVEEDKSTV